MSVKRFKFVSPGVFINEIDNSFIPKSADAIGPMVIGRAGRGLAMQPIKVQSYSEFVQLYGDTVPGNGGGDIFRDGNYQTPMYGTYASKAFLRSNVAPLTYIRLLGQQDNNADSSGYAGWKTDKTPSTEVDENGGAFGLFLFPSSSTSNSIVGTGSLAAIWYLDQSASIALSGAVYVPANAATSSWPAASGVGKVVLNNSTTKLFTAVISSSLDGDKKIGFGFNDTSENFIRKRFNTNPQLAGGSSATFFPAASRKRYFLGETYEQFIRDKSLVDAMAYGVILPLAATVIAGDGTAGTKGPHNMKESGLPSREAVAGWFIGQDIGTAASYMPVDQQKLFRLKGRGHGAWMQKNLKVSIEKIRASTSTATQYGTFSVVLRAMNDTDSNVQVIERFDNCTLDPTSPDFVARKMGNQYTKWDSTNRSLKTYEQYPNKSKFVYVEMESDVEAGATDATLLPFGYYAPPNFRTVTNVSGTYKDNALDARFVWYGGATDLLNADSLTVLSGSDENDATTTDFLVNCMSGTLVFPSARLRLSASDGGLSNQTNAYFGMSNTRTATSTRPDKSVASMHNLLYAGMPADPTSYGSKYPSQLSGAAAFAYIFSLDNVKKDSTTGVYFYLSGSRVAGNSQTSGSYTNLLDAGYNRFTAPFWGGWDGWDIYLPDPLYNNGMGVTSTSVSEINSSPYHTIRRAIDTVADPEFVDMNLLAVPGVTVNKLTTHMIDVCEERADALALVDLGNVYIPPAEQYYSDSSSRIGTTPINAANNLRDRRLDSSYGTTFYPWVQTIDAGTGILVWLPPSVAMMGVLASSQAKSDVWFAPAGFNRGGLTEGAAGIPINAVTERLTSKQRDTLYEARINPIASFPNTGIVVFGQKTLQERQSALDRINVRRLVIYLKKQISILSTQVLFEQNVQATWNRFKSLIEPFLANVKTNFGITDYRLILDESTTTPDLIDQNIMYAKIMIKPARAIEYIAIDFVVASTGASFDD
tara:strand:+ start:3635 stop:6592 length:2958 start_codon:yes stop_codon:yes gene_type:complete